LVIKGIDTIHTFSLNLLVRLKSPIIFIIEMSPYRIHPLLDKDIQKKARQYEKEKRLIALLKMFVLLFLVLAFYYSGLSAWLSNIDKDSSVILAFSVYILCFQSLIFLLAFPVGYYSGYVHEHKWNFSNQTVKSWLVEQGKSFLVGLIMMWIILGLLFLIMDEFPRYWWLIAGLVYGLISVVFSTLFPVLVFPLFNKYTPIRNKNLTGALEKLLSKEGLKSSGFFMEDMSRQTKKENASLAGLGKTRRVVLGDNLINNMSVPEIVSIMAHEVGHYKHRHMWKSLMTGTFQQVIVFFLLDRIMRFVFPGFMSGFRMNLALFPFFILLLEVISTFLFGPVGNAISRYYERQADRYALEKINDKRAFIEALAGLTNRNFINAYPEKWIKFLFYSHPPVGERLETGKK